VGNRCDIGDSRLDAPVLSSLPEDLACSAHVPETAQAPAVTIETNVGDSSDPMSIAGCQLWSEIRRCGYPVVAMSHLQTCDITNKSLSLAQIWDVLSGKDEEWPPVKTFSTMGVTSISLTPWEPLRGSNAADGLVDAAQGGLVRRLHMRLPLKPLPMAPKSTRVTVIYHLRGGSQGEPVVLTSHTVSHDVPFGSCFSVQGQMSFSAPQGAEGGMVAVYSIGFQWHHRVMIKGIIEKSTRSEVASSFKTLLTFLPSPGTSPNAGAV